MKRTVISLLSVAYIVGLYSVFAVESSHILETALNENAAADHGVKPEPNTGGISILYGAL